jgi:hypothetical protein
LPYRPRASATFRTTLTLARCNWFIGIGIGIALRFMFDDNDD